MSGYREGDVTSGAVVSSVINGDKRAIMYCIVCRQYHPDRPKSCNVGADASDESARLTSMTLICPVTLEILEINLYSNQPKASFVERTLIKPPPEKPATLTGTVVQKLPHHDKNKENGYEHQCQLLHNPPESEFDAQIWCPSCG